MPLLAELQERPRLHAEAELLRHASSCGPSGMLTYVKRSAVHSANPGYCYKCAGWHKIGRSRDGKKDLLQKPFTVAGQLESARHAA